LGLKLFQKGARQVEPDDALSSRLVEALPDALVAIDPDGRIEFVNGHCESMFGYSKSELIGQPVEVLIPDRLRRTHHNYVTEFMKAPRTRPMGVGLKLVGQKRDGTEFPVDISLTPIPTPRGNCVVAAVRDMTEREKTRQTLREAEERFHLAFEEAPIGMALVQPDGRLFRVNRSYCAIVGYSPTELTGRTFLSITHPDDLESNKEMARKLWRREIADVHIAKRYIHKNGSVVDVMIHAAPLWDPDGKPLYTIAQIQDITSAKEFERLHAEWAWVVANDLSKPLSAIVLSVESLLIGQVDETQARHTLERIKSSASRLHRMVGDLMDLRRLETHEFRLSKRTIDLDVVARSAADRMEFERPGRQVDVRVEASLGPVEADPECVEEVMDILLSNADRHADANKAILVDVRGDDGKVRVSVVSEGEGIAPEQLPHLFDRFRPGARAKVAGLREGFSMYVARELVEAHGGSIRAASLPGRRTQLEFELPRQ
jgi:protein-histidine pros-kinase